MTLRPLNQWGCKNPQFLFYALEAIMNKFNKIVFISFASLILAACGGGGGSDEPSKPTQPSRAAGMYMSAISNPVNLTVK